MPASVVAFSIVEGGRGDPRWIQGYDCCYCCSCIYYCVRFYYSTETNSRLSSSPVIATTCTLLSAMPRVFHPPFTISSSLTAPPSSTPLLCSRQSMTSPLALAL